MPDPSPGSEKARRVILLIDEDAAIGRLIRLSMHGPNCQVIVCNRHLEGLRLAARQKPDLIVMETQFKGADGLALASKLLQAPETRGSALFFLTSDDSVVSRFHGIQLGALDYVQKPIDGRKLSGRISAALTRLAGSRPAPVVGPAVGEMIGHLRQAEEAASSGVVELQRAEQYARIVFGFGELNHAECGPLTGEEALNEIASHGDWAVSFHPGTQPGSPHDQRDITAPTGEVPLRRRDTSDLTRPELPSKPVKHVPSALMATVADAAVAQPRPVAAPPAPVKTPPGAVKRMPTPAGAKTSPAAQSPPAAAKTSPAATQTSPAAKTPPGPPKPAPVKSSPTAATSPGLKVPAPGRARVEPVLPSLMPPLMGLPLLTDEEDATIVDSQHGAMMEAITQEHVAKQAIPEVLIRPSTATTAAVVDTPFETDGADDFKIPTNIGVEPPVRGTNSDLEIYDEDAPTAMSFKAAGGLADVRDLDLDKLRDMIESEQSQETETEERSEPTSSPSGAEALAPGATPVPSRETLRHWLTAVKAPPLLLAMPDREARRLLQRAAEELGFNVQAVNTGVEAYTTALRVRPVALLADLRAAELDGRELLAAVRSDFHIRETPFIIVSAEYLLGQVKAQGGATALGPILHGLESALAPRVTLHDRLRPDQGEIAGRVEPVGIAYLLRALGRAALSGRLVLRAQESRDAEVAFRRGEICGATVNLREPAVGPMAMLHLLGLEWQEYTFLPDVVDGGQVPLGDLAGLIDTACQQNNIFLARLYQLGVRQEDIVVDKQALDGYLSKLPPGSLELLVRLVEGERAAALQEQGTAPPALLKTILHDLRRKALVLPTSMRPVRVESDKLHLGVPALGATPKRRGRRWLVVLLAGLLTVLVVAGAYLVYRRVIAPQLMQRTPAVTPGVEPGTAAPPPPSPAAK